VLGRERESLSVSLIAGHVHPAQAALGSGHHSRGPAEVHVALGARRSVMSAISSRRRADDGIRDPGLER
jgi:hypothetical protein